MTCKDCIHQTFCGTFTRPMMPDIVNASERLCVDFKNKADLVEVVRCKDCKHSINLDKNCVLNRNVYKHCQLWRGEELTNIWHRYKKYYKDYSIVELDGFCDSGERRDT
jgi:hypothetical protein